MSGEAITTGGVVDGPVPMFGTSSNSATFRTNPKSTSAAAAAAAAASGARGGDNPYDHDYDRLLDVPPSSLANGRLVYNMDGIVSNSVTPVSSTDGAVIGGGGGGGEEEEGGGMTASSSATMAGIPAERSTNSAAGGMPLSQYQQYQTQGSEGVRTPGVGQAPHRPTQYSEIELGGPGLGGAAGVSEVKLRRFLEHNQRLREQLQMPRIRVSEASQR
ncbi:hypothetical protein BGZ54_002804 [Gamsiella multidivaricata]|nr:hypothetical protein BGZ54_002804 [Gamsiella multidivaricata]